MIRLLAALFIVASSISPSLARAADTAVFAGGCFWCMQGPFDALKSKGVISTKVGYTGGTKENPTYEEVSGGTTGHRESIEVTFDSKKISYNDLLDVFWKNIDPYDSYGQFCDKGDQYRAAVFFVDDTQKKLAQASKDKALKEAKEKKGFAVDILPFKKFYAAEEYHQEFYKKNSLRYNTYRRGCGRDDRLKEVWGAKAVSH